jgi:hypothetical protein
VTFLVTIVSQNVPGTTPKFWDTIVLTRYKLVNTRTAIIEVGTFNGSELQLIKGILNSPDMKEGIFKNREVKMV